MPEQPNLRKSKLRMVSSNFAFAGLAVMAVLLFAGIAASAVWRAFSADAFPPTPTIPANLESNFVYVSDQRGTVFSQPPGAAEATALQVGDTIGAGSGALVRTGADGWLRLGSQAGTFFLGAETEIELRQLADAQVSQTETILQLNEGIILVVADPEAGLRYIVFAETGARAETEVGMMGLTYARETQRFDLYCLRGPCWLLGREGETLELAAGEHGWVQGFGEPTVGGLLLYELFLELADPGLVPTPTPLAGGATAIIAPTSNQPTPTPVQLPPTQPPATFTPQPTSIATQTATATAPAATATATEAATTPATAEATATAVAGDTPVPTEAASATPLPTATITPLPSSTPAATALPTNTLPPPTPTGTSTSLPTATATPPAGTATPTATPVSPG
jgi:hypothetical protein